MKKNMFLSWFALAVITITICPVAWSAVITTVAQATYLDVGGISYSTESNPVSVTIDTALPPDPTQDTTAPSINLTGPATSAETSWVQTLKWTVTDSESGVAAVTLQWDSGTEIIVAANGTVQLPNGDHYATIKATDKAGNTASQKVGPYMVRSLLVTTPTGLLSDGFYVQNSDCTDGFRINYSAAGGPNLEEGDTALLSAGQFTTLNGEQYLSNANVVRVGSTTPASPVELSVPQIRAEAIDVGVLITVTGTVSWVKSTGEAFYVDDGTNAFDGYHYGIRVVCDGFADGSKVPTPALGTEVTVVGIGSRANVLGKIVPAIRLRGPDDIVAY